MHSWTRCSIALSVATSIFAAACGPSLPMAPTTPSEDSAFRAELPAPPAGMDPKPPQPFRCAGGDVLTVHSSTADGAETYSLLVDGTGNVAMPLLGDVHVGGLTLSEAEHRLEDEVKRLDKFGRLGLTIGDAAGHRAMVLGAVEHPGVVPVLPSTRLSELLAHGGGDKIAISEGEQIDLGDLDAGRVVRNGVALPISLSRALAGDPRHDIWIEPGDLVYVPAAHGRYVTVLGDVKLAKSFPFRAGMRLTEALSRAGGTTSSSDLSDIRIVRGPLSAPHVYQASVKALIRGEATDVLLAPGDVVFVTTGWFSSVTDVLSKLTPLLAMGALTLAIVR